MTLLLASLRAGVPTLSQLVSIVCVALVVTVQVVATEVIGAFFGGEGLGAYIRQGLGNRDDFEVQGGALVIISLAMALDLVLYLSSKALTPSGVQRASRRAQPTVRGELDDTTAVSRPADSTART